MPAIESGVKRRAKNPTEGKDVNLIVGIEGTNSEATKAIQSIGGVVEHDLPKQYLSVTIEEDHLEELCSLEVVSSVEIEGSGEVLNQADF